MPEMRKNITNGKWVVVATDRARRPGELVVAPEELKPSTEEDCPFCPGNESMTPPEVMAVRPPGSEPDSEGWKVRVFPNKFPAFTPKTEKVASQPLFPRRSAVGAHEVIVHSPSHMEHIETLSEEQVVLVIEACRERYLSHASDPRVKYVHIIINRGHEAGASLDHPHSQLFAIPVVPPALRAELAGSSRYRKMTGNCIICDMTAREEQLDERLVMRGERYSVLSPFASRVPFETWIIPRFHKSSLGEIDGSEVESLVSTLKSTLARFREKFGQIAFNLYYHSAPCDGKEYGYFHWHVEILPRLTVPGGFEWGTGIMINVVKPEDATLFLRSE